jgi:hypothetical protein
VLALGTRTRQKSDSVFDAKDTVRSNGGEAPKSLYPPRKPCRRSSNWTVGVVIRELRHIPDKPAAS